MFMMSSMEVGVIQWGFRPPVGSLLTSFVAVGFSVDSALAFGVRKTYDFSSKSPTVHYHEVPICGIFKV